MGSEMCIRDRHMTRCLCSTLLTGPPAWPIRESKRSMYTACCRIYAALYSVLHGSRRSLHVATFCVQHREVQDEERPLRVHQTGNTRDGIDWDSVARVVGTRSPHQCMTKWYHNVRPNMKAAGEWGDGEDAQLLQALWDRKPLHVCVSPSFFTCVRS